MKLWLSLLAVDVVSAFLIPYGHPSGQFGVAQRWSSSCPTQVYSTVQEPEATTRPSVMIAGLSEEEDDINDYVEEEPVDLTPEQLQALNKEEMETVIPGDGRTIAQWLEEDKPKFRDGGNVADWVKEAHRLRVMPFMERAELLKAMSFDDINQFRFRANEWGGMMIQMGLLPPPETMPEEGVTELSDAAFSDKLKTNREKYAKGAEEEVELLKVVDKMLLGATFEGTAMDNKVKVVYNGRMQPVSCEITEAALRVAPAVLATAIEAAMDAALRSSAEFYEEVIQTEYFAQAQTPTSVEGVFEAFGKKEFAVVADVVDPAQLSTKQ